jgi:hypothetical protein
MTGNRGSFLRQIIVLRRLTREEALIALLHRLDDLIGRKLVALGFRQCGSVGQLEPAKEGSTERAPRHDGGLLQRAAAAETLGLGRAAVANGIHDRHSKLV